MTTPADPKYYAYMLPLQQAIFNKDDGKLLADGTVYFWEDEARTIPKPVYEQTGSPGSYVFVSLGAVLTLSSIGTFVDGSGQNVTPFLYPFTGDPQDGYTGITQKYFIQVFSSNNILQFTIEGWPPTQFSSTSTSVFSTISTTVISTPGSGSYSPPANCKSIIVELVGAGAGAEGANTSDATTGATSGGTTSFGTLSATGGVAGIVGNFYAGTPGVGSGGDLNLTGGVGGSGGQNPTATASGAQMCTGIGGASFFGGGGSGGPNVNGGVGTSPGSGGGGGGASNTQSGCSGGGGSAGGYCRKSINTPASTYAYTVGAAGAGGTGTISNGGNGAPGIIVITEYIGTVI